MRIHLIACEVLRPEFERLRGPAACVVAVDYLPKSLHDRGCKTMRAELQRAIDAVTPDTCDVVALGYALCNNGIEGLVSRSTPLVVPRAHDCITLFLGGRARYQAEFSANPGTYYLTQGWVEYGGQGFRDGMAPQSLVGLDATYDELVEKYGDDNARYIWDTLVEAALDNYNRIAFIDTGAEKDSQAETFAREEALRRGWEFAKLRGDLTLMRRLVEGRWMDDPDFLVTPPGETIVATHGDDIVRCAGCGC